MRKAYLRFVRLVVRFLAGSGLIWLGIFLASKDNLWNDAMSDGITFWRTSGLGGILVLVGVFYIIGAVIWPVIELRQQRRNRYQQRQTAR